MASLVKETLLNSTIKYDYKPDKANIYKVSLHKGKKPSEYTWLEWDKPIPESITEKILEEYSKTLRQNDYIKQVEGILTIEAVEKAMEKYNEKVAKAESQGKTFKGLAPDPLTKDKYDSIVLKPEFSSW